MSRDHSDVGRLMPAAGAEVTLAAGETRVAEEIATMEKLATGHKSLDLMAFGSGVRRLVKTSNRPQLCKLEPRLRDNLRRSRRSAFVLVDSPLRVGKRPPQYQPCCPTAGIERCRSAS